MEINIKKLTINGNVDRNALKALNTLLTGNNRNIQFDYISQNEQSSNDKEGVFILMQNRKQREILVKPENFSSIKDAVPIGIYVCEHGKALVVALNGSDNLKLTNDTDVLVSGFKCDERETAYRDFNGKQHTEAFLKVESPAAKFCANYSCGARKKSSWWLPSFGEMDLLYRNKTAINNCLRTCGGEDIPNEWHWTSTEWSSRSAWIFYWNDGHTDYYFKSYFNRVRPVSAFPLNPSSL